MSTVAKWGLITGMVYVVISLVSNLLGIQQGMGAGASMGVGLLIWLVTLLLTFFTIYLGIKETREDQNGYLTFGEGFMAGLKMALIAALISALFTVIYMKLIDPEYMDRVMETAEDKWDEMDAPEESREMGRKFSGIMMNPFVMAAFSLVWIMIGGVVKALIASAMLKKDPPYNMPVNTPAPPPPAAPTP